MPDETTTALQEIAALLRRRIEMQEESAKRSDERMAKIDARQDVLPVTSALQEEHRKNMELIVQKDEERRELARQEKERLQEEERQFKQRLIAELERHNSILERLLSRLP